MVPVTNMRYVPLYPKLMGNNPSYFPHSHFPTNVVVREKAPWEEVLFIWLQEFANRVLLVIEPHQRSPKTSSCLLNLWSAMQKITKKKQILLWERHAKPKVRHTTSYLGSWLRWSARWGRLPLRARLSLCNRGDVWDVHEGQHTVVRAEWEEQGRSCHRFRHYLFPPFYSPSLVIFGWQITSSNTLFVMFMWCWKKYKPF